jgi:hypothetical protein
MPQGTSSKSAQTKEVTPKSAYDGPHAPVIVVERMVAYAYGGGMINVTVGAQRVFEDADGRMAADTLVTGYLKMSVTGAKRLQDAIAKALLLGEEAASRLS